MFSNLQLENVGNSFSKINTKPINTNGVPSTFDSFANIDDDEDMLLENKFNAPLRMNDQLLVENNLHLKDSKIASEIDVAWMYK